MSQVWWYLARSAGMVAWAMLTASVLWGIVLATDPFPRWRRRAWLLDLHRWLGGLTVAFLGIHLAALVADSQEHFGAWEILVPLTSAWRPWAVALGVLAMCGLVAVQGTSLAMRHLPRRAWRTIHLAAYATFVSVAFHGALAGSDATRPVYAWSSVVAIGLVLAGTTYRLVHRGKRGPRPARRLPEPVPAPARAREAMPTGGPPQ